jgi:uncharacterized protein (DUF983 family)
MAFHESHERFCPHCNERMSATAPKCLNCGRYANEDEDDEDAGSGRSRLFLIAGIVGLLVVGVVVAFLLA